MGKKMRLTSALFLAIFIINTTQFALPAHADGTSLCLVTSKSYATEGEYIVVTLYVNNVHDLWQWKTGLSWDPSVLEYVNMTKGEFPQQKSVFLSSPPESGSIAEVSNTLLVKNGVDGSGKLASFTFKTISSPADVKIELVNDWIKNSTQGHPSISYTSHDVSISLNWHGWYRSQLIPLAVIAVATMVLIVLVRSDMKKRKTLFVVVMLIMVAIASHSTCNEVNKIGVEVAHATPDRLAPSVISTKIQNITVNEDVSTILGTASTRASTNGTIAMFWYFNDGAERVLAGENPSYIFDTPGTYNITKMSVDGNFKSQNTTIKVIVKDTTPPLAIIKLASLDANNQTSINTSVTFDSSASYDPEGGSIKDYKWDFGDGTGGKGSQTSHMYTIAGTYTIKLSVTDVRGGNVGTSSLKLKVTQSTVQELTNNAQPMLYLLLLVTGASICVTALEMRRKGWFQ